MKRYIISFILSLASFLPLQVFAMEIRPAMIEWSLSPGETQTKTIYVKNNESENKTYYFQLQKFLPLGDQGQQTFLPLIDTDQLPSWTFLNDSSVKLAPGEGRAVPVTIRIPKEVAPGGYYEAFFVSSVPAVEGKMPAGFRTGTLFFVSVKGDVKTQLTVQGFERESPKQVSHLPVNMRLMLQNTGGVHVQPAGFIVVKNFFGRIVERIPVNQEGKYVLPGSRRTIDVAWEGFSKDLVTDRFWQTVKRQWRDGYCGWYTLQPEILYSDVISKRIEVLVLPWHLLIVMGSALTVILVLLRMYHAWVVKSSQNRSV